MLPIIFSRSDLFYSFRKTNNILINPGSISYEPLTWKHYLDYQNNYNTLYYNPSTNFKANSQFFQFEKYWFSTVQETKVNLPQILTKIMKDNAIQCNLKEELTNKKIELKSKELLKMEKQNNKLIENQKENSKFCCETKRDFIHFSEQENENLEVKNWRNQNNDILHILKVLRYWKNPNAISPNIFKKKIFKMSKAKNNKGNYEIYDLSRLKSFEKKNEAKFSAYNHFSKEEK